MTFSVKTVFTSAIRRQVATFGLLSNTDVIIIVKKYVQIQVTSLIYRTHIAHEACFKYVHNL